MSHIGTRSLHMLVDGQERRAECSVVEITSEETASDFLTFAEAAGAGSSGGRDWKLHIVAVQDAAVDTLWDIMWTASGTEIEVVVMPYGDQPASPATPHFEGTAVVKLPDGVMLGGEADASTSNRFTVDAIWDFVSRPTKVTS